MHEPLGPLVLSVVLQVFVDPRIDRVAPQTMSAFLIGVISEMYLKMACLPVACLVRFKVCHVSYSGLSHSLKVTVALNQLWCRFR